MKFTPATIASSLQRQGVPIAKFDKRTRRTGVHVVKGVAPIGGIWFEWQDWANTTERAIGERQVLAALSTIGLTATERVGGTGTHTGLWRIGRKPA